LISGYLKNRKYFDSTGMHADGLADRQKIPTADNFDLGIRLTFGSWHITPVGFYSRYLNKAVTIWDPSAHISYRQTVGKAKAYGSELEVTGNLFSQFSLFASATYNKSGFLDNVPASATISSDIKGMQFPDCPEYMAKLGITYMPKFLPGYEISPVLRYVGNRYGDINNKEFVHSYKTGDITMAYKLKNISSSMKDFSLSFSMLNVSNAEYISAVRAADETRGGATTYYAGYPLTCAWSVRGNF
jgi:iron complex outermembrane recepter protein